MPVVLRSIQELNTLIIQIARRTVQLQASGTVNSIKELSSRTKMDIQDSTKIESRHGMQS